LPTADRIFHMEGLVGATAVREEPADEAALIRSVRDGDRAAGEHLIRLHWDAAQQAAFLVTLDRAASEDIAQESMLSALGSLDRFDEARPFAPWLHRIVVNRALDWTRARSRRREVELDTQELAEARADSYGLDDDLLSAIHALGPEQRLMVAMRYLLGYGEGEIAELLDLPRGTVGSRLRRALDQMSVSMRGER
jgi:RNA polymerase sigma-70 factor, ECF subfamily